MPFNTPFRQSSSTYGTWSGLFPVALDGVGYVVDLRQQSGFMRASLDVLSGRQNRVKGQMALTPTDVWWETRETWDAGAGQRYADRQESIDNRFHESVGVDPWNKWGLSLLHDTSIVLSATELDGKVQLATLGKALSNDQYESWLVAAVGESLYWTKTLTEPFTWAQTTMASPILDIASDGDAIISVHTDGTVYRTDSSTGTPVLKATLTGADCIGYAKGHILVGADNTLWDVTFDAPVKVGTSNPLPGWRWRAFCEGTSAIYALGGIGDKWMVHRIAVEVSTDGTTNDVLSAPIVAAQLPDGEIGRSLGSYLGFVTVGSDQGFRLGIADATGDVTLGRLVKTNGPVHEFEGQDRFVWYTNMNFDTEGNHSGLGRMDLTTFTTPMTPAYASDLSANALGEVHSVVTFGDKRVFTVYGLGVLAETTTLVKNGWVDSGQFTWGTMDNKIALYLQVRYLPLNGTVETLVSYDQSSWISVITDSNAGSTGSGNQYLQSAVFSTMSIRVNLERSDTDATLGPTLTRLEPRVFPNAGRASEWTIPLVLWDSVEWDSQVVNRNPRADLDRLISMVETGRVVVYREANRGWNVNVTDFQWKPEKPSVYEGWQGVCTIRIREIR